MHTLMVDSLLRVAASSALGIATILVFATAPPLQGQSVPPPSCTTVVERSPSTANVVWGNWASDSLEDACASDPSADPATGCAAFDAELEWFWEVSTMDSLEAVDWCCDSCPDVQERDGDPANAPG